MPGTEIQGREGDLRVARNCVECGGHITESLVNHGSRRYVALSWDENEHSCVAALLERIEKLEAALEAKDATP
jgi:hypothetical protein